MNAYVMLIRGPHFKDCWANIENKKDVLLSSYLLSPWMRNIIKRENGSKTLKE